MSKHRVHEKLTSTSSEASSPTLENPQQLTTAMEFPDGGLVAWLQVVGAFFYIFNSWGLINSYGAFETIYQTEVLKGNSPSAIAWIGSTQAFILLVIGSITGPVFDRGYFRIQVIPGSILIVFSLFMTSLSTKYYQIFLAQGVCFGLGAGLVFIPCVAVLTTYFQRRRALVIGFAAAASGLGGVIYPAILRQLYPRIGFAWAARTVAFIVLVTLSISVVCMRRRDLPTNRRQFIDLTAFRDPPYVLFTIGLMLGFMSSYVPFIYISTFAARKTSASPELAFYFVPILNAASIPGRVLPNWAADHFGAINAQIPCAIICAVLAFAWIAVDSVSGLLAFAVLYGLFVGSFVSLPNAALANLTTDLKVVGARMGMSFTFAGIGILIGTPSAGTLIDLQNNSFVRMQVFTAVILLASAAFMTAARIAKVGTVWRAWI